MKGCSCFPGVHFESDTIAPVLCPVIIICGFGGQGVEIRVACYFSDPCYDLYMPLPH